MNPWLHSAGAYKVTKHECPHVDVPVTLAKPRAGVMHTTEGSKESALAVFEQHFAPHFLVSDDAILQLVPLGTEATSLEHDTSLPYETNKWAVVQIEIASFSQISLWLPTVETTKRLAALMATLRLECGIPLSRPYPNPLKPGITWATPSNPRRQPHPRWGSEAGWYMHLEIPGNSHWDCGNLNWEKLLDMATAKTKPPKPKLSYHITYTTRKGHLKTIVNHSPALWLGSHPHIKRRGQVLIEPIPRKKPGA